MHAGLAPCGGVLRLGICQWLTINVCFRVSGLGGVMHTERTADALSETMEDD